MLVALPVVELAKSQGHAVYVAESPDDALNRLAEGGLKAALLNMRLAAPELVSTALAMVPVACYGPHVDGTLFKEFRLLGVQDVWPNSRLRDRLGPWLAGLSSTS